MSSESADRSFEYLLNSFELASQHDQPSTVGYSKHRTALFEYVASLRSALSRQTEALERWNQIATTVVDLLEHSSAREYDSVEDSLSILKFELPAARSVPTPPEKP